MSRIFSVMHLDESSFNGDVWLQCGEALDLYQSFLHLKSGICYPLKPTIVIWYRNR
jgi:hypothetical protein